jgi:hypothetical protein
VIIPINILFYAYGAMGLYDYQPPFRAFVKGILSYLTGYFSFVLLVTIITVFYFLLDPEMRAMVRPAR